MDGSTNENVTARTPMSPVSLAQVGQQLLQEAADGGHGASALTLTPADGGTISQTVVAVREGERIGGGTWNGPATVLLLYGAGTLGSKDLVAGQWSSVEEDEHLHASEDLVALLTVAVTP